MIAAFGTCAAGSIGLWFTAAVQACTFAVVPMLASGLATGFISPVATALGLETVQPHRAGLSAAALNSARQAGGLGSNHLRFDGRLDLPFRGRAACSIGSGCGRIPCRLDRQYAVQSQSPRSGTARTRDRLNQWCSYSDPRYAVPTCDAQRFYQTQLAA